MPLMSTPCSTKSSSVIKSPSKSTKMMIEMVAERTCGRSGQVTYFISAMTP
jgi:hypothetical protein